MEDKLTDDSHDSAQSMVSEPMPVASCTRMNNIINWKSASNLLMELAWRMSFLSLH
jgi:hypothetical protein